MRNPDGAFPHYGRGLVGNSTFTMRNAGFIRLKNVSLRYALPKSIINRVGMQSASVFLNGTNLLLLQSSIKAYDPEVAGSGIPVNKSFSLGLQITF